MGGNKFSEEVHGYPLDLLNPYFKDPTEGEPDIALQEAQRLIFDKGVCVRLDPSPGPGTVTTYLDICKRVSVLLEGEKNTKLPCLGCKQYAAPYASQNFLLLSFETVAHGIVPGKCAIPVQLADPRLEVPELPSLCEDPLVEPEGVGLGPIHTARKAGVEPIEGMPNKVHKPGGALLGAITTPVPTKGITSVEPASGAVEATTMRPEVLEPREKHVEWSELQLLPLPRETPGKPGLLPREVPSMGTCRCGHKAPLPPP